MILCYNYDQYPELNLQTYIRNLYFVTPFMCMLPENCTLLPHIVVMLCYMKFSLCTHFIILFTEISFCMSLDPVFGLKKRKEKKKRN